MFVEMELSEIQLSDDINRHQVIVLKEKNGPRVFPIFIGFFEATAMDLAIKGLKTPRPLTHDLLYNILDECKLELLRVLVDDLRNDTFYGKLVIRSPLGEEILVDSRPSDAIVLASRRRLPIFVNESVLNQMMRPPQNDEDCPF